MNDHENKMLGCLADDIEIAFWEFDHLSKKPDCDSVRETFIDQVYKVIIRMEERQKVKPRWTKADKAEGRLPQIGASYEVDGCIVEHIGVGVGGYQNVFYFRYPSGGCGNCHERIAIPSKTPEEIKMDWVKNAAEISDENGETLSNIYDLMVSGKITIPGTRSN